MADIFTEVFFGSTLLQYAYFLAGIALAIIIGKTISWLFTNTLTNLAKNTKSNVDDFLVAALRKPITVVAILIGMYLSFNFLSLDQSTLALKDRVFFVVAIVFVGWLGTRISNAFIEKIVKPIAKKTSSKLDDHMLPIIDKALKVIIWVLVGIAILGNLGYDVTAILAGLGIGGLAFAFAAQKTIADVFGGVSILFSKPFVIGNTIEVKSLNIIGEVTEIGLRNTRLRDLDGRMNTVPNSDLSASVVKNITSEPDKRIITNLGLTYNTTSKKLANAKQILAKVINSNKNCKKEPIIYFNEYQASAVNLQIIYYITDKVNWQKVQDEVNSTIKEEFEKAKIEFAYPTQVLYLKK
ncbi:MAG: mechanosensitive ion channel family protein [archaeon]|jgi:MscS family membrane protein